MRTLPPKKDLTICFAHGVYRMAERFAARNTGIKHFQVGNFDDLKARIHEADIVSVSMMWKNELIAAAPKLAMIQSISAGTDQYDFAAFKQTGVRLASGKGVNANAVAQHAIALTLALARQLHTGRDNQAKKHWRGMIGNIPEREDELGGKTMLIVGLGAIGGTLARLAQAFGMRVIAAKRDVTTGAENVDAVFTLKDLPKHLPEADVVALTCPLTAETTNLIDAKAFAAMKPSAYLINVARGKVVDEAALIASLSDKTIAAAGIDVTHEEPLPEGSPLWTIPNALITPHTAGETQRYEDNVIDLLIENIDRVHRGEKLVNEMVG
ncbi:glyoxylate/hydroxypyruvate reductase B [Variibacter gotjawalensis]|uniref:Glyoxylate/hydroxypyruvate reductase B n=1 Tax=Variibacter gotjawalensis TaxID=1333996 RepID=A0A0S3PQP3_9BRAD|nr:D-2-hydroxyacid dehydrogenase [Variibacter gotjawalensis]NIK48548.1 phosphoglycerate dehydrogenase-like enzyme [Variibacter gotjawalensis]RZS50413.1 phosphoglycerate dehydrogenase-like enzyme [Variibacter gotjawalensis]BAT58247.1 glyoxylate/hydroxypyruvate reductase B [Variibacter gotjawalensis]